MLRATLLPGEFAAGTRAAVKSCALSSGGRRPCGRVARQRRCDLRVRIGNLAAPASPNHADGASLPGDDDLIRPPLPSRLMSPGKCPDLAWLSGPGDWLAVS